MWRKRWAPQLSGPPLRQAQLLLLYTHYLRILPQQAWKKSSVAPISRLQRPSSQKSQELHYCERPVICQEGVYNCTVATKVSPPTLRKAEPFLFTCNMTTDSMRKTLPIRAILQEPASGGSALGQSWIHSLVSSQSFQRMNFYNVLYKNNTWMWYSVQQSPYNAFSIQKG